MSKPHATGDLGVLLQKVGDVAVAVLHRDGDALSGASRDALQGLARILHEGAAEYAGQTERQTKKPSPTDYLAFGVAPLPSLNGSPREAYERVEAWFRAWLHRPTNASSYSYEETRAVHRARNQACWEIGCRATTEGNEPGGIGWLVLDVATYNALHKSYYSRISELAQMTDEQLDDISRIGPKRVSAIRVAIERYEMDHR